jgi:glutamine amidotransferase
MQSATRPSLQPVEVVDLETGNIGSVLNMLSRMGCAPRVVRTPSDMLSKYPVLLPGVGHFSKAAASLDISGFRSRLDELYAADWPILGICVGAQLMCRGSEEGPGAGLGWLPTTVRRFPPTDQQGSPVRVPHMAWQTFAPPNGILPFSMPAGRVYFTHSYYLDPAPLGTMSICETEFGGVRFTSVARSRNAIGAQFHPEKSLHHGMAFLGGWLAWSAAEVARR